MELGGLDKFICQTKKVDFKDLINQFVIGDCLEALKLFPDNSISLTVTSPPYDKIRDYHGIKPINWFELGKELYRVTVPGGVCVVVIQDQTKDFKKSLTSFKSCLAFVSMGWGLFETCIYQRSGTPGKWWNERFRVDHEFIFIFFKGDRPKYFNKEPLMVPTEYPGRKFQGTKRATNNELVVINSKEFVKDRKCRGTIWKYANTSQAGESEKNSNYNTLPHIPINLLKTSFFVSQDPKT